MNYCIIIFSGVNNIALYKCSFYGFKNVGYAKNGEKICHFYDMSLWWGGWCSNFMHVRIYIIGDVVCNLHVKVRPFDLETQLELHFNWLSLNTSTEIYNIFS